jgi:hypothetical protein
MIYLFKPRLTPKKITNVMFWHWENLYFHESLRQGAFGLAKGM